MTENSSCISPRQCEQLRSEWDYCAGVGGVLASTSNFLTITRNTRGLNPTGIDLADSSSNAISENDGNVTGIEIFNFSPLPASTVSHNIVNGNGVAGVVSEGIVAVENNVVSGNGMDGIHVLSQVGDFTGSQIINNTVWRME